MNSLTNHSIAEAEVDRSILKIAFLAVFGMGAFSAFGYFLKSFIIYEDLDSLIICGFLMSLALVIFNLQAIFIKDFRIMSLVIFLECLGMAAMFYDKINLQIIGSAFGAFLILLFAGHSGLNELANMLKINFWRVGRAVLPKAITALALFMSINFAVIAGAEKDFFISKDNFEKIVMPGLPLVERFFSDFNATSSIRDFAYNLAVRQINQAPNVSILPKSAKTELINQSIGEFEKKISSMAGAPIDSSMNFSAAMYEILKNRFLKMSEDNRSFALAVIIIILFLIIKGFAWPIRLIVSLFGYVIYESLIALGFAAVVLEERSREIIILK